MCVDHGVSGPARATDLRQAHLDIRESKDKARGGLPAQGTESMRNGYLGRPAMLRKPARDAILTIISTLKKVAPKASYRDFMVAELRKEARSCVGALTQETAALFSVIWLWMMVYVVENMAQISCAFFF